VELVTVLLEAHASANAADSRGMTPLFYAARHGHLDVTDALLAHGASPGTKNAAGNIAMHIAASYGSLSVVRVLLAALPGSLSALGHAKRTPLHSAALHGHLEVCEFLLGRDADPGLADLDGRSPLHHAAAAGYGAVTALLLRKAPHLRTVRDADGCTPHDLSAGVNMPRKLRVPPPKPPLVGKTGLQPEVISVSKQLLQLHCHPCLRKAACFRVVLATGPGSSAKRTRSASAERVMAGTKSPRAVGGRGAVRVLAVSATSRLVRVRADGVVLTVPERHPDTKDLLFAPGERLAIRISWLSAAGWSTPTPITLVSIPN
jgi:hypothetical protein